MRSGLIVVVAALLSLALVLPGCGDEGTATVGGDKKDTSASKAKTSAPAATPSRVKRCGRELGDFFDSIESLGNTLAVGLDYEQYVGSVNRVRASYSSVAVDRLGLVCLSRAAAPAEAALNLYIDAANEWGDCLAGPSCDSESIEPELQREWERASARLTQAQAGLRDLG